MVAACEAPGCMASNASNASSAAARRALITLSVTFHSGMLDGKTGGHGVNCYLPGSLSSRVAEYTVPRNTTFLALAMCDPSRAPKQVTET